MADVRDQKRVLRTITDPVEKPTLIWMAERLPAWVTPDILTTIGLLGSAIVFAGYALSRVSPWWLWFSTFGLVVNWFGDSTDGTLARVRHTERPRYGFFIDHTMDVVSEGLIFLGLGVSPYMRFDAACVAFIGYLSMSVHAYVRAFVDGVFKISYSRIGPTELRIVLVVVNAAMFFGGAPKAIVTVSGQAINAYDAVLLAVALGLAVAFVGSTVKGLRELADVDVRSRT
ncbi:MAG: CDP-alcohol phosphatidyltransferase family protein [Coriobacteriia bacterium]|nr:CDP-alcohol phosphatidyltransferase family protein [Coriobacteriia bacterium]